MDSGAPSSAPLAYYDHDLSCWRTSQLSFLDDRDLMSSLVTFPRSGSMRSGACFERPTLAPRTGERGCSSSRTGVHWPTANSMDGLRAGKADDPEAWKAHFAKHAARGRWASHPWRAGC